MFYTTHTHTPTHTHTHTRTHTHAHTHIHTHLTITDKNCECQPDEWDYNLIVNNHKECSYPPEINLMISIKTTWCGKVTRILQYHVSNNLLSPEKFARYSLHSFYPFRDEKVLTKFSTNGSKQIARRRTAECCKYKQIIVWMTWGFSWSTFLVI